MIDRKVAWKVMIRAMLDGDWRTALRILRGIG
jgi:hypothetical protein